MQLRRDNTPSNYSKGTAIARRGVVLLVLVTLFLLAAPGMEQALAQSSAADTVIFTEDDKMAFELGFAVFSLMSIPQWVVLFLAPLVNYSLGLWLVAKWLAPHRATFSNGLRATLAMVYAGPIVLYVLFIPLILFWSILMALLGGSAILVLIVVLTGAFALSIWVAVKIMDRYFDAGALSGLGMMLLAFVIMAVGNYLCNEAVTFTMPQEKRQLLKELSAFALTHEEGTPLSPQHRALHHKVTNYKAHLLERRIERGDYSDLTLNERIEIRKMLQERTADLKQRAREARDQRNKAAQNELQEEAREFKQQLQAFQEAMKAYSKGEIL